jgi:apolipoprotein N-acyltransferase
VRVVQGNVPRLRTRTSTPSGPRCSTTTCRRRAISPRTSGPVASSSRTSSSGRRTPPTSTLHHPEAYDAIDRAVEDIGVPVLVGAVLQGPGEKISNAGIVWDPVTGPGERYVKRHPVPFGEYIPFRSLAPRITERVDLVPATSPPGTASASWTSVRCGWVT